MTQLILATRRYSARVDRVWVFLAVALAALALDPRTPSPCVCVDAQVDSLRTRAHLLWTEPSPREVNMDLPQMTAPPARIRS